MDNLDALMNKTSYKSKRNTEKTYTKPKHQISHISNQMSSPLSSIHSCASPITPIFRPQQSPKDLLPEILLPMSEISSDDNEGSDQLSEEIDVFKQKHFSCPNGPTLNVWVNNGFQDDGHFEMIEENDGDLFNLNDDQNFEKPYGMNNKLISTLMVQEKVVTLEVDSQKTLTMQKKKSTNGLELKRFRSQSENITACTIFKFLEGGQLSQRRQFFE